MLSTEQIHNSVGFNQVEPYKVRERAKGKRLEVLEHHKGMPRQGIQRVLQVGSPPPRNTGQGWQLPLDRIFLVPGKLLTGKGVYH